MHANDYLWELILTAYPFRWIVGRKVAAGSTGCVFRHGSRLLALTVQYGKPPGAPVIYGYHHAFRGTVIYPLMDPFFIEIPDVIGPDNRKTYLVCSELMDPILPEDSSGGLDARYQEVGPEGDVLEEKIRKPGDLHPGRVPNLSDRYGFSCFRDILARLDDYDHLTFVEKNLEFTGKSHGLFRFRAAHKDEPFKLPSGCQGAPILDEDARIVSLITGGDSKKRIYYGLDLWKFLSESQFSGEGH
ncbi:MAG TPA: hypothetical protein DEA96_12360 [Leptospiraceae bacterium]|nr:hypothetical protein [Spirochaetaceae bacterium]HBS05754.1 hypothetical protein [Leptospiraceae bacterium]